MSSEEPSPAFEKFYAKMQRKSPATKKTYVDSLMQFRKAHFIDSWEFMLEGKIEELEARIKEYLPTKSHTVANKLYWALRTFYAANGVKLNWDDDLKDYIPLRKPIIVYRPRTKEEIEAMLKIAELREQVAVLLMSTGGLRIGALPTLLIEDCIWLEGPALYCLKAYPGTSDEYLFFITPQASKALKKYIGRRSKGPIFVSKHAEDWQAVEVALARAVMRLSQKAGVYYPKEVQTDHGFRHFFRTKLEASRIHDDFAERLMGHKKEKLKKVYSHPEPLELFEASEYHKAIGKLTFDVII